MNYQFQWRVVSSNWEFLVSGIWLTLVVTAAALAAAMLIGLLVGLLRVSHRPWVTRLGLVYVEVFRNTPALVQLIWVYYCLPVLTGIDLSPAASCTVALAINGGAYLAEIFRAGIQSIDRGQVEAASSLGMPYLLTMLKIVLPQAIRRMIPPFVNEAVSLLKYSSLVSVLGVADLTYQAQVLSTTTFRPIEIFTFIGAVYLAICWAISYAAQLCGRWLATGER